MIQALLAILIALSIAAQPDRLLLLADTQSSHYGTQQLVVQAASARDNEYLVFAGDVVALDKCKPKTGQCADHLWLTQLQALEPLRELQRHLAPGNHDYGNENPPSAWALDAWERWAGPRYHAFDSRHACFYLVDDNLWDARQIAWLDEAVTRCQRPWKILVKHQPEGLNTFGYLDFDLIVTAHTHQFAAWAEGRTLNLTLPPASHSTFNPRPITGQAITPVSVPMVGFGELEISPTELRWRVFRHDGALLIERMINE